MVGGAYIDRNYRAAAEGGRIVQIAFQTGARTEVDFTRLLARRLVHTGSTLRPRTVAQGLETNVWPLLEKGRVKPVVARTFALAEAAEAHRCLEAGALIGKLVLTTEPSEP